MRRASSLRSAAACCRASRSGQFGRERSARNQRQAVVLDYRSARALVLACIVAPTCAAAAGPNYIPIVSARVQPQGTTVAVMGLVTVPSGNFQSSSGDEGFAIQDQTAGIWISVKQNLKLKVGQRVLVSGTLGESFGKLQIVPHDVADVAALPGGKLRVATG